MLQVARTICSAEGMDLTTGNLNMEETLKFTFFVYSMLASPQKRLSFFYIFDARSVNPGGAVRYVTLCHVMSSILHFP